MSACASVPQAVRNPVPNSRVGFFDRRPGANKSPDVVKTMRSKSVETRSRSITLTQSHPIRYSQEELAAQSKAQRITEQRAKSIRDRLDPNRVGPVGDGAFQWPVKKVEVTSSFGKRGKVFHEGIDLRAPEGTTVYAAQDGMVLYADAQIKGYGKMVVIRHPNLTATLYAHNSEVLVKRGERVKKGQEIALSGSTGHSTGPHVHFEIRKGLGALNPLRYLPRLARMFRLASAQ